MDYLRRMILELEVTQMKCDRSQVSESILPRTPGQDRGQVWISDDFNAELPEPILNDFLNLFCDCSTSGSANRASVLNSGIFH